MKTRMSRRREEVELKLALPVSQAARLEGQLAQLPVLQGCKKTQLHLHNVYWDTPDQVLRKHQMVLRLRRFGSDNKPQWVQTLKMGGSNVSALSRRGEWEVPVSGAKLSLEALQGSPWSDVDPDGVIFNALAPCFVTTFERTSWQVHGANDSRIEVSLDVGRITANHQHATICELELELLEGQPPALFEMARHIACAIPTIPLSMSKAERGYALAEGSLRQPVRSHPPGLTSEMSLTFAAACLLREMLSQFTANLVLLRHSNAPELVHQARVGWRRFRSALRLFRPAWVGVEPPSWQALHPLLKHLGELRDLDVAVVDTLPRLAAAYAAGDFRRENRWQAMQKTLTQAAMRRRRAVLRTLAQPAVGVALLSLVAWLENLSHQPVPGKGGRDVKASLRRWARHRMARLHHRLSAKSDKAGDLESQHRVRILAKRLRYGVESLQPLLAQRHAQSWYQQATTLQAKLGWTRDVMQAAVLAESLGVDADIIAFLRGVKG